MGSVEKVHNTRSGKSAKIDLRRRVLEHVGDAHVLDVFCGCSGAMYQGAWKEASGYTGIDREWSPEDERRRFVGDAYRIVQAIDLRPFNVVDIDAFGSPWGMAQLLLRRRWSRGELGALVVTDGSLGRLQYGIVPRSMQPLVGVARCAPSDGGGRLVQDRAFWSWVQRAGVEVLHRWQAETRRSGASGLVMVYMAAVFRGQG